MTNLSLVSPDGVSENQVIRSNVAKTQQPDAERLKSELYLRSYRRWRKNPSHRMVRCFRYY